MECNKQIVDHNHNYTLSGKFTFADHGIFKHIIDAIKSGEAASVTLDVSGLEFVDSAALGMLLIAREEGQKKGITIALAGAQGQVQKMFSVSRFETLFTLR